MNTCCDLQGHDCRQGRDCTQRNNVRTCDELGLCQNRTPRCPGCTPHFFAPGVIEGGPSERQTRALMHWTLICAGVMAVVAVVAFTAGFLS